MNKEECKTCGGYGMLEGAPEGESGHCAACDGYGFLYYAPGGGRMKEEEIEQLAKLKERFEKKKAKMLSYLDDGWQDNESTHYCIDKIMWLFVRHISEGGVVNDEVRAMAMEALEMDERCECRWWA